MVRAASTLAGQVCLLAFIDTIGGCLGTLIVGDGLGVLT